MPVNGSGSNSRSGKDALQSIIGIMLAGVLYAVLSVYLLYIIVGLCYVLSGVSEMFICYEHQPKEEKLSVHIALSDMREGILYLKSQKAIMAIMAAAQLFSYLAAPYCLLLALPVLQ